MSVETPWRIVDELAAGEARALRRVAELETDVAWRDEIISVALQQLHATTRRVVRTRASLRRLLESERERRPQSSRRRAG